MDGLERKDSTKQLVMNQGKELDLPKKGKSQGSEIGNKVIEIFVFRNFNLWITNNMRNLVFELF